jgi:hypothetical protein
MEKKVGLLPGFVPMTIASLSWNHISEHEVRLCLNDEEGPMTDIVLFSRWSVAWEKMYQVGGASCFEFLMLKEQVSGGVALVAPIDLPHF